MPPPRHHLLRLLSLHVHTHSYTQTYTHAPLGAPRTERVFLRASLPANFLCTAAVRRRIKLVRRDRRRWSAAKTARHSAPCTRTNGPRDRPRTRARGADRNREVATARLMVSEGLYVNPASTASESQGQREKRNATTVVQKCRVECRCMSARGGLDVGRVDTMSELIKESADRE